METNFGGTTSVASTPSLVEWKNLRFLITDAPKDNNISVYIKLFKKYNASHIVRISEPLYKKEDVEKAGIQLHEMHFPDGDSPPDEIINKFLDLVTTVFNNPVVVDGVMPCIVVHCVAGLGRAPVLTAIALIEQGLDAMTAVQFIRSKRRGAINSLQLAYLETYEPRGNKGSKCSIM